MNTKRIACSSRRLLAVVLALVLGPATLTAQCRLPDAQWLRSAADDRGFGTSVAVDGVRLAIGAPWSATQSGNGSGLVHLYELQHGDWIHEETLYPRGGSNLDDFGTSIELSGDLLMIGSPRSRADLGRADVYDHSSGSWRHAQRLLPSSESHFGWYGHAVAFDGTWAFVSAPRHDYIGIERGAVFVFEFNGNRWVERQILAPGSLGPADLFGHSISVDGDLLVVGVPLHDAQGTNAGSAFVFQRQGQVWNLVDQLFGSGVEGDEFGRSVAVQGSRIVVGAPFEDGKRADRGAAYVFEPVGGSFALTQRLEGRQARRHRELGSSVALDGDTVLVGAPEVTEDGPSFVGVFRLVGATWVEVGELLVESIDDDRGLGNAVDLDGPRVVAGAVDLDQAFAYDLPALLLAADDRDLAPGDPVTFSACSGTPGNTTLLCALEFDGVPHFQRLRSGVLDGNGDWSTTFTTPPGLAGHTVLVGSFSLIGGKIEPSNTVELRFD